MNLTDLILNRRSIRKYTAHSIDTKVISEIVKAGIAAPTGKNIRPVEFITVDGREELEKLSKAKAAGSAMLAEASAAIVVIGNRELSDTWIEDCSVAMSFMMLKAQEDGIGSCWVQCRLRESSVEGMSAEEYVKNLLNIPERYGVLSILSLGMSAEEKAAHTPDEYSIEKIHFSEF